MFQEDDVHELPLTKRLLDIAIDHARRNQAKKITAIHLSIGEMSDLEPEALTRYFNHLARGTEAEGASVIIRSVPVLFLCNACGAIFPVPESDVSAVCAGCGEARRITLRAGREFTVDAIVIKDSPHE